MSENLLKQLKDMAQISMVTGRISTIQEKNLKLYPFIFFDGVLEVEISYDLSPIKSAENGSDLVATKSFVTFDIKTDRREIQDLDRRCTAIDRAVATLLWSGIIVEVVIDGDRKYGDPNGR